MQLNRVLKGLAIVLPILAITACSKKNASSDEAGMNNTTGSGEYGSSAGMDENARLALQELQRKNIVYFGFDRYDVSPEYAQILDEHANFLRNNPSYKVVIEGHADERGTPEYNIALGERRATAVQMYLQGKGVSADQLSIVSYGKEKPAVLGHDEAAWAKNRRAVLVY
ncbi:MAG: peptidoglycan-associated lipoprotein Pal [Enterobacteriaceae bacterium]